MNAPLDHKARIVAELQDRLANAETEDDQDFIADELTVAAADLESMLHYAARQNEADEAMVEALKQIEAAKKARRQRVEQRIEKRRAAMAWAMQEAGLPKSTSAEFTISFRMGKPPLVIDRDPGPLDCAGGFAVEKKTYAWDKDKLRLALEDGPLSCARLGNPAPVLTVRGK